jgi:predicted dinucleotide-binding enzyme
MGSAISKSLAKGNYRLLLCSDDKGKIQAVSNDIKSGNPSADVKVVDCSKQASWEADIIIAAVPHQAGKEVAAKIKE